MNITTIVKNLTADFADIIPPQPVLVTVVVQMTPLARAVESYNARFHEDLRLPLHADTVEMAAHLAELRGAHQVAKDLREAVAQEASV